MTGLAQGPTLDVLAIIPSLVRQPLSLPKLLWTANQVSFIGSIEILPEVVHSANPGVNSFIFDRIPFTPPAPTNELLGASAIREVGCG